MGMDIYMEKVLGAKVADGIVTIDLGTDKGDNESEETARLRIPLTRFQDVATRFRDILLKAMEDGWYGEPGIKAVEKVRGETV